MPDDRSSRTTGGTPTLGRSQRRAPRYTFLAAAEVTELSSGTCVSARTSELSLTGCRIHCIKSFAAGALVQVRLFRERDVLEVTAKVVYFNPATGMGVAFTSLTSQQRSVLERWLTGLGSPPFSIT